MTFSPDGKRLLSGSRDQTVRPWDVESGEVLHSFTGHEGEIRAVIVWRDGRRALSGSRGRTVRHWRLPR